MTLFSNAKFKIFMIGVKIQYFEEKNYFTTTQYKRKSYKIKGWGVENMNLPSIMVNIMYPHEFAHKII